jgi:alpha-galactosidase
MTTPALALALLLLFTCTTTHAAETPPILTPKPPSTPRINGPASSASAPIPRFIYRIPATGQRPMEFSIDNLPTGLKVEPQPPARSPATRPLPANSLVTLRAKNSLASAQKKFKIIVGEKIALTPPMGWNSWNCWGGRVSAEKVLLSARGMVNSGLIDHGWTYINIDDAWQGKRGGEFNAIQGNENFPT